MENSERLERLGKRFPNKSIGIGNPDAKILVVTQKEGNEEADLAYLRNVFNAFTEEPDVNHDVLKRCYYMVFDEEILKDSFFEHFKIIQYVFLDREHLMEHNPAELFKMEWTCRCIASDFIIQYPKERNINWSSANYEGAEHHFISFSLNENNKVERIMISTPPFDKISKKTFYNNIVFYDNCIDENFISVNDLIGELKQLSLWAIKKAII